MSFLSYAKNYQSVVDVFMRDPKRYLPFAQLLETLMGGESELNSAERETIALYVSKLNSCHYCVGSHQEVLQKLGADQAAIDGAAAGSTANADARMRPVLEFADKLTLSPGSVNQADVDAVVAAGWSEQTVEDIIGIVSLFSFLNRLVDGLGIEGSSESFAAAGGMIAQHGYGPVVQMIQEKAQAA